MNTCHTSTSEPNKGQVNRQSREIVCYSPPQRLPSVCIWQTTTVARDATMLRLMLMMFLPVSLRAMVLLPPPGKTTEFSLKETASELFDTHAIELTTNFRHNISFTSMGDNCLKLFCLGVGREMRRKQLVGPK